MRIGIYEERSDNIEGPPELIDQLDLADGPSDIFELKKQIHSMLSQKGWHVRSVNHLSDTSQFDVRTVVSRVDAAPLEQRQKPTHRGGIHGGHLSDRVPPLSTSKGTPAMSALQRALTRARSGR